MLTVRAVDSTSWSHMGAVSHHFVFGEKAPADHTAIDFALCTFDQNDQIVGYVTVKLLAHEVAYWKYGGSFPNAKGTTISWESYRQFVKWHKENGYKVVTTLIENVNNTMLKFALKMGFQIIGMKIMSQKLYIELVLDLTKEGN